MSRLAAAFALIGAAQAADPTDLRAFHEPARLCEWLHAGTWEPIAKPPAPDARVPYSCQSHDFREHASVPGLPSFPLVQPSIFIRVFGPTAGVADSISVSAVLRRGDTRGSRKKEFLATVDAVFRAIAVPMPRGLEESMANEQRYMYHASYGTLSFLKVLSPDRKGPPGENDTDGTVWFRLRKRE